MVVCIPVFGAHDHFVQCLESVLQHTGSDVPILVCDDASPDARSEAFVRELEDRPGRHELFYLRREQNVGFPANVNGAFAAAAPADVVVLNSDCVVAAGWLEGLRDAAYSDSNVATASALADNASVLSVPGLDDLLAQGLTLERAAGALRAQSLRLRPRLLTAVGHCMYVRRTALELAGNFDLAFSPGYGEEVDFSQRCLQMALSHVAADDVLVLHHGGVSLAVNGAVNPVKLANEERLGERFPYYHPSVEGLRLDPRGSLSHALSVARRAVKGLSVAVDARILTGPITGTHVHVLELLAAIARTGEARVSAIVPPDLSVDAVRALDALSEVELVTAHDALRGKLDVDVIHRPFHVTTPADLTFLAQVSDRLVVTHHDLISYRNPTYFGSYLEWQGYRELTRRVLAVVDHAVFDSSHARDDAFAEQLVEPHRASVVHCGVDHGLRGLAPSPTPPAGAADLPAAVQTIVCIGTDFRHKNRLFALRVLAELQRRHDWGGRLILAGPHVVLGSSRPEEEEEMGRTPRLADAVLDFGALSEAEKAWLLGHASLVLYPTVYEGFGLVPFEAAEYGVPCLWAAGTSLAEVLPETAAGVVAWDAAATADRAIELLRNASSRADLVEAVRAASLNLRWADAGLRLIEVYRAACNAPPSPGIAWERTRGMMRRGLSDDALRLLGPEGILPPELERPLLALATHPQIGQPLFGMIRAGYRAAARLRRLGLRRVSRQPV